MMKNKVRITALHLSHGGIEMAITSLSNALVRRGYEMEILCTYNLGQPAYPLDERVQVTYLTNVKPNREAFQRALRQKNLPAIFREGLYAVRVLRLKKKVLIQQFRKIRDGVIISTRHEDSVLLSKYGNAGVRKIAQLHRDHCFDKKLLQEFVSSYNNIDVFTLLTPQLQQEVSEIMKDNHRTQCVCVPNFLPETKTVTAEMQNQAVAVGRLHPEKGFLRLIRLWKPIYEQTGTILKIVGGGNQQAELEQKIATQGLTEGVVLTGMLEHDRVLEEMKKSVFYAMTSLSEGLPFVLIEAMAQGVPAIAYDVRVGPRAVITDGENGFLIQEDDAQGFAEKALMLIQNPDLRAKMAQAAVQSAANYTEDAVLRKWQTLLDA
jgi:N-acetylglucosaminyldiphosphoundecaprenol N-acetyl-beta-D-mannosaminyltransferase